MAHKIINPDTLYDPVAYGFSHSIQAAGKTRVYCDKLPIISEETTRFFGNEAPRPNTLIGVAALALPEFLVEIEATAEV